MTNVDGLTMENVSMSGSTAADSLSKCKNLTFKNCDFTGSKTQRSVFGATEGVTLTGSVFDGDYTDVPADTWYTDAVYAAREAGTMLGMSDKIFAPDAQLSRAQVAQILYNRAGRPAHSDAQAFADVDKDAWFYDAVQWAAENGVASGMGNKKFAPNEAVTREQLAQFLYAEAGTPAASGTLDFVDANTVSGWATPAVTWAVQNHVISGDKQSDGTLLLNPRGNTTRAQTAVMLNNLAS